MVNELPLSQPATTDAPECRGLILVVDDEEQNRVLLRDPLETRGYRVMEAENGTDALQKISGLHPDVVLLDIMMPGMDGFEVCRTLKKNPETAPIPVLMVTALSERKERLMGIVAGANDFLHKPVDLQEVMLRVDNAAYTKRLFDKLQLEQKKSEQLLLTILPKAVAERMKKGESNIADAYPEVTVLFADLVGFTTLSANIGPDQVVYLLNEIFCSFDGLTERHGVEKIKTIGDAYMVAGGIPVPRSDHAEAVTELAFSMREELARFNTQYDTNLRVRTGISTGPVIAGVIGRKKFAYDVWGDTVNLASRLASLAEPGGIQVAEATYEFLKHRMHLQRLAAAKPQKLAVKGLGELVSYCI